MDNNEKKVEVNSSERKSSKKIFIIIGLLIVILVVIVLLVVFLMKKNDTPLEEVRKYGISSYFRTNEYRIINNYGDYYVAKDIENKTVIIDRDSKVYLTIGKKDVTFYGYDNYYILGIDDKYSLYNKDFEKLVDTVDYVYVYKDEKDGSIYFEVEDNKKRWISDENVKEIYSNNKMNTELIYDKKLYSNKKIYDLNTKEKVGTYESFSYIGEDFLYVVKSKKSYIVYSLKDGKEYKFDKLDFVADKYVFSNQDNKLILNNEGEEISADMINRVIIDDNYYLDSSSCDVGYVLKNKDGKELYSKCTLEYELSSLDKEIFAVYENEKTIVKLFDGHEFESDEYMSLSNGYFISKTDNGTIIRDNKGNPIETEISKKARVLSYIDNDMYYVLINGKYVITDSKFEKKYGEYEQVSCYDDGIMYCVIKENNLYGLFVNGEVFIEPSYVYYTEDIRGGRLFFNQVLNTLVVEFGIIENEVTKEEVKFEDEKIGEEIDVEHFIKEYHLENIKDSISANEDFFKKYAYIVEKNSNLGTYKKQVLDEFLVVVDHKDKLDENWFLYNLKDLSIEETDDLATPNAAGEFYSGSNKILLKYTQGRVVYHELLHFLDYNFNFENYYNDLYYYCDKKLYSEDDYLSFDSDKKDSCVVAREVSSNFITEYGAEKYTALYFNNGGITSYHYAGLVYENLNYIFGNDIMGDIFFSRNSEYDLFKLLVVDTGLDYEVYKDFMAYADMLRDFNTYDFSTALVKVSDYLIDIYKLKNPSKKGNEDKEFLYNVSLLSGNSRKKSKYDKEYNRKDYYLKVDNLVSTKVSDVTYDDSVSYSYYSSNSINMYFKDGSSYFMNVSKYGDNSYETGYFKVDFDFVNEKVNNYEFFEDVIS